MFALFFDSLLVLGIVALIGWVWFPSSWKRFTNAGKSQVNKASRAAERIDPVANLERVIDEAVHNISRMKEGLTKTGTFIKSLEREISELLIEKVRLENRIKTVQKNGDPNKTARQYALQLSQVDRRLESKKDQLEKYKTIYSRFADKIRNAETTIITARSKSAQMTCDLEQSQNEKELSEMMANDLDFDPTGLFSELAAATDIITERIDQNAAAIDVVNEFAKEEDAEAADTALTENAEVDAILSRYSEPEKPEDCTAAGAVPDQIVVTESSGDSGSGTGFEGSGADFSSSDDSGSSDDSSDDSDD